MCVLIKLDANTEKNAILRTITRIIRKIKFKNLVGIDLLVLQKVRKQGRFWHERTLKILV